MNSKQRVSFLTIAVGVSLFLLLVMDLLASAASNGNYALDFDGSTDLVELSTTANIMAPTWITTKTVSMWIRPLGGYTCSIDEPASCDAIFGDSPRWWGISRGMYLGQDRIWVWNWATSGGLRRIGVPYTVGEWMHIALVHGMVDCVLIKMGWR
ncbi:MAG: LamG domain-containing protein [Anaerolineae bacterium]|nr:LamG domain-containing protein [Anaerolineae bacterium]